MSDTIVVLDNDLISLWCYPEKSMIHHVMHRPTAGLPLRYALKMGTEAMKANRACKWLSDDRNNTAPTAEDMRFFPEVWFPTALKAGWKFWALVMPLSVADQLPMRALAKTYSQRGVVTQLFSDPDAAMQWLDAQHQHQGASGGR